MLIGYNVHPFAMHTKGGGEVQLLRYVELMRARGIGIELHDIWNPAFDRIDLMHHFHLLSGGIPILQYLKELGIPTLVSTNMWIDDSNRSRIDLTEIKTFLAVADYFVTNSKAEIINLSAQTGANTHKGRVIYNGVDPKLAEPVNTEDFARILPFDGPYVLTLANIEPRKNQLRLIEAAHMLDLPVVCLGGVRDVNYLAQCQATAGHFYHLGSFEHNDPILHAALQHADVFALPSTFETPGLAALEAAVCGAQIVITSGGSTHEYFGPYAHYVDPSSSDSIASGIETAFRSHLDPADTRHHILQHFSWDVIAADLINLYRSILHPSQSDNQARP